MSKRYDNRKLLYILGGLVVVLTLTFLVKIPRQKSTLKGTLVNLDTSAVSRIVMTPKNNPSGSFEFTKEKGKWTVRQGSIISEPEHGAVQNILAEVISIKPQSLAAVSQSKWKEFDLTDSLATGVKLLNNKGKTLASVLIGRFSYRQPSNPYNMGGNNIEGTTYVRLNGENEVYAVDGFLAFSFSGDFPDYRNKTLTRFTRNDVTSLRFTMPGDSSYTLIKKESRWFIDEMQADSAAVTDYLTSLSRVNGDSFIDGYKTSSNPVYLVSIEGNNLVNFTVKAYAADRNGEFILNSSLNPEAYLISKRNGELSDIFKPKEQFIKGKKGMKGR
jgi:hypothetical protein